LASSKYETNMLLKKCNQSRLENIENDGDCVLDDMDDEF
jgi:hypothetical protein